MGETRGSQQNRLLSEAKESTRIQAAFGLVAESGSCEFALTALTPFVLLVGEAGESHSKPG